jgi:uncharacterized damage-inducible protein DinB
MTTFGQPEVWLRGPLPDVPALLQPVAHALLQAREEVNALMNEFPDALLWERPANVASVAFHLQHLTGVLDRLFSYAQERPLSDSQLTNLANEGKYDAALDVTGRQLVQVFNEQVDTALAQLRSTDEQTLTQVRYVGRGRIPSTHVGLLVHAAEHTTRHVGQLLVTVRFLTDPKTKQPS